MDQSKSMKFENSIKRPKNILDLDDACLIYLFNLLNPLPDLFNAARSCKVILILTRHLIYFAKNQKQNIF
jgi:hypothetical protein